MRCFHCGAEDKLVLAALSPQERRNYPAADITLRICTECGWMQNHWHAGDGETVSPQEAARTATERRYE